MVVAVAVAVAVAVTIVVVRAAAAAAVGVESPAAVTAGRGGNREVEAVVSEQTPDGEAAGEDGTTARQCMPRGQGERAPSSDAESWGRGCPRGWCSVRGSTPDNEFN